MYKTALGAAVALLTIIPSVTFAKVVKDTTPPAVTSVSIRSNGPDAHFARPGDTVTITFTASERVETPVVLANALPILVRANNTGSNTWAATFTVGANDHDGTVNYLIAMEDLADNAYACSSVKTPFQILVKYCPPTDGSSVTITHTPITPPPPPVDTVPPVIAPHADVMTSLTHAADTSVAVPYTLPTATDNHDGTDPVACVPVSGSSFSVGSTTVACRAQDAAGNTATSSFVVGVYPFVPQPVTLAAQSDESYQCLPDESDGWRACYTGGDAFNTFSTKLGAGSGLQAGALTGVTISLDPNFASAIPANPFRISITCYTDATYTTPCGDWVTSNGIHDHSYVLEDALATTDNKHWTANLNTSNEANFDGSKPVVFKSNYYYKLTIQDLGVGWPMNGQNPATTATPQPYWVVSGVTQ